MLEQVYKDFGVVFHPNSTVTEVRELYKGEASNGKSTSEASGKIRQGNSEIQGLVGKAKEDKEQQVESLFGRYINIKYHPAMI